MTKNLCRVGLLVCAIWAWASIEAMAADEGGYLNGGIGLNIVNDFKFTAPGFGPGKVTAEMDPGFRFSVAGGYRFNPMISAELETGFIFNQMDAISVPGGSFDVDDVSVSHVPFLGNVVFRFENSSRIVPFIGAGAGGVLSMLDLDDDDLDSNESDSDFVFAWQAFAGVVYKINDSMSAGVTYKYLGVDRPEFRIEGDRFKFDTVHNHSILATF